MFQKTVLNNGLRVITCHMPHTRSVSVVLAVGAGSRYESDKEAGAFHFVEHLLFKGTKNRPDVESISGSIENVGGFINATTDKEITMLICSVTPSHFSLSMEVLFDMVKNPLLDRDELDKERSVILEELALTRDRPDYRVDLLMDKILWPDHPLGRDVGGEEDSVKKLDRDTILRLKESQYNPKNMVLSVAGNVSHGEVLEMTEKNLADWTYGTPLASFPLKEKDCQLDKAAVEYSKTDRGYLSLSWPGLSAVDDDRFALDLLGTVLGGGMTSRLFLELRERKALVYDVYSSVVHLTDCGAITINFASDPARAKDVVGIVLKECEKLQDMNVSKQEIIRAVELSKGRIIMRMENSRSIASWLGMQEILANRLLSLDDVISSYEAVTPGDLRRVAGNLLSRDKCLLAAVGPFETLGTFANFSAW